MELRRFYQEVLNGHNSSPDYKGTLSDATAALEGVNPSCGDDIVLQLKIEDGRIADGRFEGNGCAVSQASADIMLDLVIGKTEEEARRLAGLFIDMVQGKASEEILEELEEAAAFQDIAHMPARVKCAVLGWRTLTEMLKPNPGQPSERISI